MSNSITSELVDFGAAVAMQTSGQQLLEIKRINERQCVFIFYPSKDFDRLLKQYWAGTLKVSAIDFHQRGKALKNRLHATSL